MDNGRIAEKAKGVQIRDVRLFVMLSVIILLAELVCFYVKYPEGGSKERIYAAYMVYEGYVP